MLMLNHLALSLQFGKLDDAALHRAALPRHKVARWIRHALQSDAEITVRIVDEAEGLALNRDYRKKDYATNVLTFDYTMEPVVTLHAQGWDHETSEEDAQVMELREVEILARLGFDSPY